MMYILQNKSGLKIQFLSNLSLHSIFFQNLLVNLYFGNELEHSVANLYLCFHTDGNTKSIPLFSPLGSPIVRTSEKIISIERNVDGFRIKIKLELHPKQNCWKIETNIQNLNPESYAVSLVYTQDFGLCDPSSARLNEAFVSHYIHHEVILNPQYGYSILSRQNELVNGKNPASFVFCDQYISTFATDGQNIYQNGNIKPFSNSNYQGEHSVIGLSTPEILISSSESFVCNYYASVFENLDQIESFIFDQSIIDSCINGWESDDGPLITKEKTNISLFHKNQILNGDPITEKTLKELFPDPLRNVERGIDGSILSFFIEEKSHVSLFKKESLCLRSQGQVLRTGTNLTPNESSLTTTAYFNGIFISQLTQGHASANQLIARKSGDLGTNQSKGLRIFCKISDEWVRLENPSYLKFHPNHLEWVYLWKNQSIQINLSANENDSVSLLVSHSFPHPIETIFVIATSLDGDNGNLPIPPSISISNHSIIVSPNPKSLCFERFQGKGFRIQSESVPSFLISDDRILFESQSSQNLPYLTIKTKIQSSLSLQIFGELVTNDGIGILPSNHQLTICNSFLMDQTITFNDPAFIEMVEILPWYKQNAEIHYLNPRGLEQFSGGGWGTRDVCQGAFEFLLASGNFWAIRDLLIRVFREQNEDGDWPQWFMLYEKDKHIRANDSHGDILYWPILSVFTYLERTGDTSLLSEVGNNRSILEGIELTLKEITNRFIPNTVLPKYGNGDWNDSMQPKEESFRNEAVSPWTAELQSILFQKAEWFYQMLGNKEKESYYVSITQTLKNQIRKECMDSGIIAGLVHFSPNHSKQFLLHPNDQFSTIQYSILPMIYGILSDVFTLEEAESHLTVIKNHLTGPDGVRLFDKPVPYQNGKSTFFKRAETASYFGREIGLMYTHAHLRYCEALAHMGKSDEFFNQLNLTNPIGITKRIPNCRIRQANCYYSSSDAVFLNRSDASSNYEKLIQGKIPLEGGWRVYSSGPGIFLKLFYESLLGIQIYHDGLILDPMLSIAFHGLKVDFEIFSIQFRLSYEITSNKGLIHSVTMNGKPIETLRMPNQYRMGGLKLSKDDLCKERKEGTNSLEIFIQ
ncbi:Cellobiose phosphorylase [Leptospira biflexa serovar Patoc strain 'Patoc 1 (Ames)']|uniref:Putative cellobiose phosphorylase n=2 Tax=Leptospira biflexa TaxID=172 RepID=B0SL03_LEPBP|nr:Cellobiose phosphorylase [Leptospira biflexa serovar Patoc strain 'Patoc 1 (Ames)']ABZ98496.1 Putative cellobiose phosphorylase [Leptospira biflexa serovar Patoc strain 'Patoc 1 (Paris)']